MGKIINKSENKEKIGTILDKDVIKIIKDRSKKEDKTIGEIIENAVILYNKEDPIKQELRIATVNRFCSKPFSIKFSELEDILSEDNN